MNGAAANDSRIALLIDADNSPASKIDLILAELAKMGLVNVRRAYGNWKKNELKGWEAALHEHAIRPVQQFDVSKGKNATDMCMAIDAMHLLYTDRPDAFALVSSDSDFTPLVLHLKEKGARVYGFGQGSKTPSPFVDACSNFLDLDKLGSDEGNGSSGADSKGGPVARMPTGKLRQDARLVTLLRNAVEAARDDDGWALLNVVRQQIQNQASFDSRNYGYASFSKLVAATELFEMVNEGTSKVAVRDKRQAKAATRKAD